MIFSKLLWHGSFYATWGLSLQAAYRWPSLTTGGRAFCLASVLAAVLFTKLIRKEIARNIRQSIVDDLALRGHFSPRSCAKELLVITFSDRPKDELIKMRSYRRFVAVCKAFESGAIDYPRFTRLISAIQKDIDKEIKAS